jgi:hypothetical protein
MDGWVSTVTRYEVGESEFDSRQRSNSFFSTGVAVTLSSYFSILKMEAKPSSETSVNFYRITIRHVPEDYTLHRDRCENHKSLTAVNQLSNCQFLKKYSALFNYLLHLYLSVSLSIALQPLLGLGRFFRLLIFFTQSVEFLGWGISPSQGATYTQNNTNTE